MLNRNQIDALSGVLSNLGTGVLLIGAFSPLVVHTDLRYDLSLNSLVSSVSGVAIIVVSILLKKG